MLVLVCLLLLLGAVSPFTPAPFLLSYNALSTRLHAVRFSVPDNLPVSTTVREGVTSLYDDNGESLASSDLSQTVPETEADGGALYDQSSQSPPDPRAFVLKTVAPAVVSVGGVATAAYLGLTSFNRKQASLVATFANEMVYHSNNHDELRLCYMETKKKLWGKKEVRTKGGGERRGEQRPPQSDRPKLFGSTVRLNCAAQTGRFAQEHTQEHTLEHTHTGAPHSKHQFLLFTRVTDCPRASFHIARSCRPLPCPPPLTHNTFPADPYL